MKVGDARKYSLLLWRLVWKGRRQNDSQRLRFSSGRDKSGEGRQRHRDQRRKAKTKIDSNTESVEMEGRTKERGRQEERDGGGKKRKSEGNTNEEKMRNRRRPILRKPLLMIIITERAILFNIINAKTTICVSACHTSIPYLIINLHCYYCSS